MPKGFFKTEPPSFEREQDLYQKHFEVVIGLDEVGRGALAGPVVACSVFLGVSSHIYRDILIRDSKQLSPGARERSCNALLDQLSSVGDFSVGCATEKEIDDYGIAPATRMAMVRAVEGMHVQPDAMLIDAVRLSELPIYQEAIIRGDQLSLSIAAASIIAKVTRDRLMIDMETEYPGYGFAGNKGYGSGEHMRALRNLGPSSFHRRSFQPTRGMLT
jgi:ribonuclease HII